MLRPYKHGDHLVLIGWLSAQLASLLPGCVTLTDYSAVLNFSFRGLLSGDDKGCFLGELCACVVLGRSGAEWVLEVCQLFLSHVVSTAAPSEGGLAPMFQVEIWKLTEWRSWSEAKSYSPCITE